MIFQDFGDGYKVRATHNEQRQQYFPSLLKNTEEVTVQPLLPLNRLPSLPLPQSSLHSGEQNCHLWPDADPAVTREI